MATTLETVSALYKNILGRDGLADEISYWAGRIDSGAEGVADVVSAFTGSSEALTTVAPIVSLYFAAFGRVPDVGGLQYWVTAQRDGIQGERRAGDGSVGGLGRVGQPRRGISCDPHPDRSSAGRVSVSGALPGGPATVASLVGSWSWSSC